ncbi:MAG: hypothetical protein Q7S72_01270 [Candidatus Taylorbacteria bacterium]|nr:hypothetical protein [Candidatus Taylorbacteria bacterium]
MPKTKNRDVEIKEEAKPIILDDVSDPELIVGDVITDADEEEEVALADDEEVDPFKDRWEE